MISLSGTGNEGTSAPKTLIEHDQLKVSLEALAVFIPDVNLMLKSIPNFFENQV